MLRPTLHTQIAVMFVDLMNDTNPASHIHNVFTNFGEVVLQKTNIVTALRQCKAGLIIYNLCVLSTLVAVRFLRPDPRVVFCVYWHGHWAASCVQLLLAGSIDGSFVVACSFSEVPWFRFWQETLGV
jgi:hypothetical protein